MKRWFLMLMLVGSPLVCSSVAQAQQYVSNTPEGPKIVHTRLAPVVMHRILPPHAGKHIYRR